MSPLYLIDRIKKAATKYTGSRQQRPAEDTNVYGTGGVAAAATTTAGVGGGGALATDNYLHLRRTASVDSQCTLVEPPQPPRPSALYITQSAGGGGNYRGGRHSAPLNGADGRRRGRPHSQFTIGPRRVIVCA
ncbi:hypothetical protein GGI11_006793 [Coemansia sp. RSA 2049]|nr:hypothetical protein GGI11_006793 [Coemansia sp. RSA 2049]KAJ2515145.1 hypothetical protein H4217_005353 [Coemansia sp. RSA 1939]KAJ2669492.1 hypothetical protein GGH99_006329 [Coemansia sp. RSA 1285]